MKVSIQKFFRTLYFIVCNFRYGCFIIFFFSDTFVIGGEYVEETQNCVGGRGCGVLEDRSQPMMMMMDTSNLPVIGIGRNKRNLKIKRVRKYGKK